MLNDNRLLEHPGISSVCQTLAGLCLAVLFLLSSGCDYQTADKPAATTNPITLRMGHDMPADSAHHVAALQFAKLVAQRSNNRLLITVYPDQTLGNDYEMIAMAQAGELDIILPPTAKLSPIAPSFQIFDLPFFFHDRDEAYRVLDGPAGRALIKKLQPLGLTGISFWESGFKQLTADRPIKAEKDLAGLKFRVMRSGVLRDQFEAWGAETIAIEFGKTRQALADAVVNGQENPLGTIYNMKFHDVQSHLILSNHGYLAQLLAISNKTLHNLPTDLQDILLMTGQEMAAFQRTEAADREQRYLDKLKQTPIRIQPLDPQTRQGLFEHSRFIMEKHRFEIGTEIVELALQTIDESIKFSPDELVIALDADMAGNSAVSGLAIRRGIEIAIHEINRQGGVLGRNLRLTTRDNSMVSARGLDNLQRFASIPNLVAVFGGISSPVVLSELELIHQKKILFLDPWAAASAITENGYQPNYVFRVSVNDRLAANFLLNKALKISPRLALLMVNNDWGRSNHDAISHEMQKRGLGITAQKWFDWGDTKLAGKLDEIAQSGAEVIIYVGNVVEAAKMIKHMADKQIRIPVISHWGIAGGDITGLTGTSLDKVEISVLQTFSFIGNKKPLARKVSELYRQLYGITTVDQIPAPVGTVHAYDLTHLLVRAIRKAGRYDMPSIRNAMERLGQYNGLVRKYRPAFSKTRHDALDETDYFLAVYRDGTLLPLK